MSDRAKRVIPKPKSLPTPAARRRSALKAPLSTPETKVIEQSKPIEAIPGKADSTCQKDHPSSQPPLDAAPEGKDCLTTPEPEPQQDFISSEPQEEKIEDKLEQIRNSMPSFLQTLAQQSEEKRKAEELRFRCLQECVVRLAHNLDLEKQKRLLVFQQLTDRLSQSFKAVLETASKESESRFQELQLVCKATGERLTKISCDLDEKDDRIQKVKLIYEKLTASSSDIANQLENDCRISEEASQALQMRITSEMKGIEQKMNDVFARMQTELHTLQTELRRLDTFNGDNEAKTKARLVDTFSEMQQLLRQEEQERKQNLAKIVQTIDTMTAKIKECCLSAV